MYLEQSKTVWIDANDYPTDPHYFRVSSRLFRVLLVILRLELNKQNEIHLILKRIALTGTTAHTTSSVTFSVSAAEIIPYSIS
jgi:hypothetical protein